MRWLTIAAALSALVFAVAGCGGGDDEAGDDTEVVATDTTTDDTTTDDTTTDDTTTDTETDTVDLGDLSDECIELAAALAAFVQAFAAPGTSESDEASEFFERFADEAPVEIQDDIRIVAQAYAEYIAAFADLDLQPGETPSAEQLLQLQQTLAARVDQANVAAAQQEINAWIEANCS